MINVATRRRSNPSPLRYPGGKASLAGFFEEVIRALALNKPTYIEPYAGGAGAGLELLYRGVVGHLVINDLDYAVYSLWDSMLNRHEEFLDRFDSVPLTVAEWKRQREIFRRRDEPGLDKLDLGFATFYLNRTNRSGVLRGGIIGGLEQEGVYKLDARFNKDTLRHRITAVGKHRSKISVTHQDGAVRLRHWLAKENVFAYVDPPYYEKGSALYLNSFNDDQHRDLASWLNALADANWVLTYDRANFIKALYSDRTSLDFNLHYSAHRREVASEFMVVSNAVARALGQQ
ncbi:DNA adenine methylase [Kribbella sp. NPDC000426]|uniref:DNA adenine methylase n=1 Tax=Kribbella sp. NPDC000426 TaxID=3154255 RepID=UPI00332C8F85